MYKFEIKDKYITWVVLHDGPPTDLQGEDPEKGLYKTTKFKFYSIGNYKGSELRELGYFYFSPMPGCCGIVISHDTFLNKNFRGSAVSDPFRKIKNELAKQLGYTVMIATTQMENLPGVGNMMKSGYKIPLTFTNKRTNNLLGLGYKVL